MSVLIDKLGLATGLSIMIEEQPLLSPAIGLCSD